MNRLTVAMLLVAGLCMAEEPTLPKVANVSMMFAPASRQVTITYDVLEAPAVITLDVQTNSVDGGWVSIGSRNFVNATGELNMRVEPGTGHRIKWEPEFSWPDHLIQDHGARAVVTAWAVDNTPDYLVVDLAPVSTRRVRYYADVESLPGGLLENEAYRTTMLVLKKIVARDVMWSMGAGAGEASRQNNEVLHTVTLPNNYYLAVFETTQGQWAEIMAGTGNSAQPTFTGNMRPMESISFNEVRESAKTGTDSRYRYPAGPCPDSFLGRLSERTGIAFDLPSEAQWEYACKAGHGDNTYGDGTRYDTSTSGMFPGRCLNTGGSTDATAVVGSYSPNSWGLYDMHGNVAELVLDFYVAEWTEPNGLVQYESGSGPVKRGGAYNLGASSCRSSTRADAGVSSRPNTNGFRVCARAGLK